MALTSNAISSLPIDRMKTFVFDTYLEYSSTMVLLNRFKNVNEGNSFTTHREKLPDGKWLFQVTRHLDR